MRGNAAATIDGAWILRDAWMAMVHAHRDGPRRLTNNARSRGPGRRPGRRCCTSRTAAARRSSPAPPPSAAAPPPVARCAGGSPRPPAGCFQVPRRTLEQRFSRTASTLACDCAESLPRRALFDERAVGIIAILWATLCFLGKQHHLARHRQPVLRLAVQPRLERRLRAVRGVV